MKDFTQVTRLTAAQRSAIRANAQDFARNHDLDADVAAMQWQALAALKADTRRAARDIVAEIREGTPEHIAAAIEKAQDALLALIDMVEAEMDARSARGNRAPSTDIDERTAAPVEFKSSSSPYPVEAAYALETRQTMRAWAQARGGDAGLSAGAYLRALVTGPKTDAEHRALSAGTDAAGGFSVPTITSAELIDLVRAEMVLARAGARVVPLTSNETIFAKVLTDPQPAFRAENSAVTESNPTFGAVTLAPKSIAVLVKASVELMADSINLERELPRIMARAMAVEIDRAGLLGSGTNNEPRGIANFQALTPNGFAGGNFSGFGPLLKARGALHGVNERLNAFIMAPRTENGFASLIDANGQPLNMPRVLEEVQMLHTTAIPTDLGTGEDETLIIGGDFTQLMMGVRSDIRVEILRERFMDNLQFGLIAHARVDFAAARESAFTVLPDVGEASSPST